MKTVTYPIEVPLEMFRDAEQIAATENRTLGDLVNDCLRGAIEEFQNRMQIEAQRKKDAETLKRLTKKNRITIIKQDFHE